MEEVTRIGNEENKEKSDGGVINEDTGMSIR